jgi:hypothetical protein
MPVKDTYWDDIAAQMQTSQSAPVEPAPEDDYWKAIKEEAEGPSRDEILKLMQASDKGPHDPGGSGAGDWY